MVEGPGTTRNGMKASQLLNQKVCNVVVSDGNKRLDQQQWWANRRFTQVIKIGKELFLLFSLCDDENHSKMKTFSMEDQECNQSKITFDDDLAIRLHFQMNGSLHIEKNHYRDPPFHSVAATHGGTRTSNLNGVPTLEIALESHILRTYRTSISAPMSAKAPRLRFQRLSLHDVCNPDFALQSVLQQLHSPKLHISRETLISDVLLDQNILPGIGNIIKVEGLHNAKIHPKKPLSVLTEIELSSVILCCKEYAMKWLQSGRAPLKRVYNQTICGTCHNASVRICRVGGTNRTTFWCCQCQVLDRYNNNASPLGGENNEIYSQTSNTHTKEEAPLKDTNQMQSLRIGKVCPNHGPSKMALKRCRKIGANEQRIFYSCNSKGCNFFCWADFNFPRCKCDKRTVLRISKTEKTGGRWFFSCSKRDGKINGCQFFEWAESKHLERFGKLLTPLL